MHADILSLTPGGIPPSLWKRLCSQSREANVGVYNPSGQAITCSRSCSGI